LKAELVIWNRRLKF